MAPHILLVEDDPTIREILVIYLSKKYEVALATRGFEAAKLIKDGNFDLILLDLMLPEISGETLAQIANLKDIPIMMITAKNSEEDILNGLKLGAVDYITKPFSPKVLMAKIENFFTRRSKDGKKSMVSLSVDERTLLAKNRKIYLTPIETKLLEVMMNNPEKVYSREDLLKMAWNEERSERIVDATVKNLRKKLDGSGIKIKTMIGIGYAIEREEIIN